MTVTEPSVYARAGAIAEPFMILIRQELAREDITEPEARKRFDEALDDALRTVHEVDDLAAICVELSS